MKKEIDYVISEVFDDIGDAYTYVEDRVLRQPGDLIYIALSSGVNFVLEVAKDLSVHGHQDDEIGKDWIIDGYRCFTTAPRGIIHKETFMIKSPANFKQVRKMRFSPDGVGNFTTINPDTITQSSGWQYPGELDDGDSILLLSTKSDSGVYTRIPGSGHGHNHIQKGDITFMVEGVPGWFFLMNMGNQIKGICGFDMFYTDPDRDICRNEAIITTGLGIGVKAIDYKLGIVHNASHGVAQQQDAFKRAMRGV